MSGPSRAAYALAIVQAAGFAYFVFPAVLAVLLTAGRGGDFGETAGSALFGLAIAGLGLLFLVGFLFLVPLLVLAALVVFGLRLVSACSQISLTVCSGLIGLIVGSWFAQFPQVPAEIGGLAGTLVGGGSGLLMWKTLSGHQPGMRRSSGSIDA
jgi:hypothetical protein